MDGVQEKELMKAFGRRVKELRRGRSLTQEQLATAIGTSVSTVAFIETGVRWVRLSTLRKLAETLGVEIKELFEGI